MRIKRQTSIFTLVLAICVLPSVANAACSQIPDSPALLNEDQLTHKQIEEANVSMTTFMEQLTALRECVEAESDALVPPVIEVVDGEEVEMDPAFLEATQALSAAILQIDSLESIAIERFNYLAENSVPEQDQSSSNNQTDSQ